MSHPASPPPLPPQTPCPPSPAYDLPRLRGLHASLPSYRSACLVLARAAERGERFDDAARFAREIMRCTAQDGSEMEDDEKNILYIAYRNVLHKLRTSHKTMVRAQLKAQDEMKKPSYSAAQPTPETLHPDVLGEYLLHLECQIQSLCLEVTQLMENSVVKTSQRVESKVFFSRLCGDYYRYCSEVIHDKQIRINYEKKCFEHYSYALKLAHSLLLPNHPQRLGISLNYSVCLYELLGDKKQACDLAKNAFDSAIQKLDELDEVSYKDATLIMQLLRDNLTLWTQQENATTPSQERAR